MDENNEENSINKLIVDVEGLENELRKATEQSEGKHVSKEEEIERLKLVVEDLEKFKKFAVGRELKMIELKKRIKQLEELNTKLKSKK